MGWSALTIPVLEFITMSLDNGIVLPGVTRMSIIEMLQDHASGAEDTLLESLPREVRVVERDFSMPEVVESIADGTLKAWVNAPGWTCLLRVLVNAVFDHTLTCRLFGCGTGVVITSIREIQYENQMHQIPYSPHVLLLRDVLTGLQRGKIDHEWSYKVQQWGGAKDEQEEAEKQQVVA
jgi:branched-chain amino acid aminotransferase